jgi:hypothetical protein
MIRTKLFPGCALAFIVSLAIGTTAIAQEPVDQRTYFTFSAPFELPGGKTLPAGRYTFRIVDSPSNRHVVQILSEDGKQMHATIMAIPAQRQDPRSAHGGIQDERLVTNSSIRKIRLAASLRISERAC